jgi:MTH538 TIR-like domain (DUF1863)
VSRPPSLMPHPDAIAARCLSLLSRQTTGRHLTSVPAAALAALASRLPIALCPCRSASARLSNHRDAQGWQEAVSAPAARRLVRKARGGYSGARQSPRLLLELAPNSRMISRARVRARVRWASHCLSSALWPKPSNALGNLLAATPPATKRRVYFAFHFDDVMRVNNVMRGRSTIQTTRSIGASKNSSLWERRQIEGDDAVKRLIREGVQYTSVVCVLAGSETWSRRWVRYEIARAVIDGRGLLTIHINSINHHRTSAPSPRGSNPLDYVAVGKIANNAFAATRYFLFERRSVFRFGQYQWEWQRYEDYTEPVDLPRWLADPAPGWIMPLSHNAGEHDYIQQLGHKNLGAWIDAAAVQAGR